MSSENSEGPTPQPPADPPAARAVPPEQVILISRPADDIWINEPAPDIRRGPRTKLALLLFLLTCLSTFLVGYVGDSLTALLDFDFGRLHAVFVTTWRAHLANGLLYSGCVMAILTAHELGHFLQARRYGVPASLPFFIPFPISPFGTMGAVIVQQSGVADRKSMFDIAISGPLAGLVVALPLAYFGIRQAHFGWIVPAANQTVRIYADPLLLKWMIRIVHGPIPAGAEIMLNPMLFAGWVGIFITALNLIPIGQLDGGHILYCLIGRRAHLVARGLFFLAASMVAFSVVFGDGRYMVWSLMLFLIWLFGTRHPPTANDRVPLGRGRIVLGSITLLFIIIGLTPTPIYEVEYKPRVRPPIRRDAGQEVRVELNLRRQTPA